MRTWTALAVCGALCACACQGQLPDRPRIGVKIGPSFSSVDNDTRLFWNIGADVAIPFTVLGGAGRGDVDYFKGPESSQLRFGLSQTWSATAVEGGKPYGGAGIGFLFDNKRHETDRSVLSLKLFGGFEFGKDTFLEVGILQSSRTDGVFFDIGMRF